MINFQRNFLIGEVEIEGFVIYYKIEYRERRNYFVFYLVNVFIFGFDIDRDIFLGFYRGFENFAVVERGRSFNFEVYGWLLIVFYMIEISFLLNEIKEFVFVFGYVENEFEKKWFKKGVINKEKVYKMIEKFLKLEDVNAVFEKLKEFWDKFLDKFNVLIGIDKVDRIVNIWN